MDDMAALFIALPAVTGKTAHINVLKIEMILEASMDECVIYLVSGGTVRVFKKASEVFEKMNEAYSGVMP